MKDANAEIAAETAGIPNRSIEVDDEARSATLGDVWGQWQQRADGWSYKVGVTMLDGHFTMQYEHNAHNAAMARFYCLEYVGWLDMQAKKIFPLAFKQE